MQLVVPSSNILYKTTTPQSQNFASKGLTHYVRKHRLTPTDADKILAANPNTSRYLGDIPHDWLNLTKTNINETDKMVKNALSSFAKLTYDNSEYYSDYTEECKLLSKALSNILNTQTKVHHVDDGDTGKVFCINVNNQKYALKTFHNIKHCGRHRNGHGMQYEPLDAAFVSKNIPASSNRYTTFYLGKYAKESDGDGFILSSFIDKTTPKAKKHVLRNYIEPVYSIDTYHQNHINGRIYDIGGLKYRYQDYSPEKMHYIRVLCDFINRADSKSYKDFEKEHASSGIFQKAKTDLSKQLAFIYGTVEMNNCLNDERRLNSKQYSTLREII